MTLLVTFDSAQRAWRKDGVLQHEEDEHLTRGHTNNHTIPLWPELFKTLKKTHKIIWSKITLWFLELLWSVTSVTDWGGRDIMFLCSDHRSGWGGGEDRRLMSINILGTAMTTLLLWSSKETSVWAIDTLLLLLQPCVWSFEGPSSVLRISYLNWERVIEWECSRTKNLKQNIVWQIKEITHQKWLCLFVTDLTVNLITSKQIITHTRAPLL